ncbi:MAG: HlyC/CorC family transporter [Acidobacteria bacterium]|nr:HlyC/CorC family transporter [Acidobacteriota bacterium]
MLIVHLAIIVGLVALNAFFVGAEYAFLSFRRSRLQQLVREGDSRAILVHKLLNNPSLLFSGLQLGISAASLLMGWVGEVMLAAYLREILSGMIERLAGPAAHVVATVVWFSIITLVLMVLGELAPKTIGYERAEIVSLLLAWPVTIFMRLAYYPVAFMDWLANQVARLVGVVPTIGHTEAHTPEEVKLIVAGIRKRGLLAEKQEEMIHSVIDLHRVRVREVMVPWNKTTCLPLSQDLSRILERVVEDEHSRIPIYEGSPDHIVGVLHTKDLLRVVTERRKQGLPLDAPLDLRALLHDPMIVPETMTLNRLLEESRRRHSQMALVVDEFGTFVGVATIEDVLEQIVGEIQDEYDEEEMAIRHVSENVLVVDGALSLRDLADDYEIVLPRGAGYETLAGFVVARLGFIPRGGESFVFEGRRYTVLEMDARRVARARVEKLPGVVASAVKPPVA